jgi:hypothetical protein
LNNHLHFLFQLHQVKEKFVEKEQSYQELKDKASRRVRKQLFSLILSAHKAQLMVANTCNSAYVWIMYTLAQPSDLGMGQTAVYEVHIGPTK